MQNVHVEEYPLILIYGLRESNDLEYFKSTSNTECRRELDITIDIRYKQKNYIDKKAITSYVDEIALEVEKILYLNNNLNGKCSFIRLSNTSIGIDDTAEYLVASCNLYYNCTYYIDYFDDLKTEDFLRATADIKTTNKEQQKQKFNVRDIKIGGTI